MTTLFVDQEQPSVPRRSGPGGLWDYVSPSRLGLWLKCPLAFRFRYVDGIRRAATPALFLGKAAHAALAFRYEARRRSETIEPADVERELAAQWERLVTEEAMTFEGAQDEAALRAQAWQLVLAYLDTAPKDEPLPLAVEAPVEAPLVDPKTGEDLGIPLFGILDLVLDDPDGAVIVDFKTASRAGAAVAILHEVQLSSYAYAYRSASGEHESGLEIRSLVKTKAPKVEFHRWPARSEAHWGRLFAVLRAYFDGLTSGRFECRPGGSCSTCDFSGNPCRA